MSEQVKGPKGNIKNSRKMSKVGMNKTEDVGSNKIISCVARLSAARIMNLISLTKLFGPRITSVTDDELRKPKSEQY